MKAYLTFFLIALFVCHVVGDCYMHSPRGSVNRFRGDQNNNNRLFDSQNNNNGGYCWGPTMSFYEGSFLQIEWTSQHGCGSSHGKVDCDIVLQYMCADYLRDGTEDTRPDADNYDELNENGEYRFGMHESYSYYRKCENRRRNKGLFIADRNVGDSATRTRQNNNGNRNGWECPEERDYYPYWHPSPWRDIVAFVGDARRCAFIQQHSQNVEDKYWCEAAGTEINEEAERHNTEEDCTKAGFVWKKVSSWGIEAPQCHVAGWNRDNHLGNGVSGFTNAYTWTLPSVAMLSDSIIKNPKKESEEVVPCVLRIRYNISTSDYVGGVENTGLTYETGGFADDRLNGEKSPIKNNPYVKFGRRPGEEKEWELRLAINTAQFGRVFQDRSHVFYIKRRPFGVVGPIYNLMVRGKRGNIVQTFPAVEYDFTPNFLEIAQGEHIHFQWTGCDTHNGGQAGQGRDKTDRSNFVVLSQDPIKGAARTNYPEKFEKINIFGIAGTDATLEMNWKFAYLNQYNGKQCASSTDQNCCLSKEQLEEVHGNANSNGATNDKRNCALMNADGHEYFDGGLVSMVTPGTFHYMSSRNNAFSNRSQKGTILVSSRLSPIALAAAIVGGVGFVAALVVGIGSHLANSGNAAAGNIFNGVKV